MTVPSSDWSVGRDISFCRDSLDAGTGMMAIIYLISLSTVMIHINDSKLIYIASVNGGSRRS